MVDFFRPYCIGVKLPGLELSYARDQRKFSEIYSIWGKISFCYLSLYRVVQRWRFFLHSDLGVPIDDR